MILVDIINDPLVSATVASVATLGAQKFFNRKVDTQEIVKGQITMLSDLNIKLNTAVEQLQEIACYRKGCNERINGETKTV